MGKKMDAISGYSSRDSFFGLAFLSKDLGVYSK